MKILHAPGKCMYCDMYPDWQELRQLWGLNFTGENDIDKATDPAEIDRDLETINRWGGNVPVTE